MRVGLRRLRAALSTFKELLHGSELLSVKRDLKWLSEQLSPARDVDVLLEKRVNHLRDHTPVAAETRVLGRALGMEREGIHSHEPADDSGLGHVRPAPDVRLAYGNCWRCRGRQPMSDPPFLPTLGRRAFLRAAAAVTALPLTGAARESRAAAEPSAAKMAGEPDMVVVRINGQDRALSLDPRTTLLDALREHVGLTGTKKGCGHGQCGACTVHVDGERVLSCMTFAVMAEGHEVTTIEGLAGADGQLHPMQQAFIDHDALQCGYCTPGQVMSAVACVKEGHADTDDDIREYMSGNLCRCAAYPNIVAAVRQAKRLMKA
jgi:xanthine dehydrogenase YagT iron-sulfur-binding subunit